jgi:hypothetical protein
MLKVTMVNKGININCSKIHVSVLFVDCYKTDRHDVTEILLKVALNTIKQTNLFCHNMKKTIYTIEMNNIDAVS